LQEHGEDPRRHARSNAQLFHAAEQAKHALSVRAQTSVTAVHGRRSTVVVTSRQQFEDLTDDLLQRTAFTTRQVLAAANVSWEDVDRLLLVGGSTRMPMVARMLEKLSGLTPDRSVNPDEAVARGAALYADYLLSPEGVTGGAPRFKVVDVNSHSLGIEGINKRTHRKENVILIPRNTPLPAERTRRCKTKVEGQKSVVIKVLEGEGIAPASCSTIGKAVLYQLPRICRRDIRST